MSQPQSVGFISRYKGEILIIASTLGWGISYLFNKTALRTLGAFNLVALRYTLACLITIAFFNRQVRGIGRGELAHGCILGALLWVSSGLLSVGLTSTSVANAGFIIGSMVLFVAILDSVVMRKRPHLGLVVGVLCALAGIGVLTLRGTLSIASGDAYCLGATVTLALHVMTAQKAARYADPVGASIVQFAATAVLAWLTAFAVGPVVFAPDTTTFLAVLGLSVFGTAMAFVCQVAGQKYLSPTRTAFLFTLEPIFATLFAWVFLREAVTWHVYAGGGLLLAGVYVSEYGNKDKG